MMPNTQDLEREIEQNYNVFMEQMDHLLRDKREGQYALMRNRAIIEFFQSPGDAVDTGNNLFEDRLFSVQEVRSKPFDLGCFSHGGAFSDV